VPDLILHIEVSPPPRLSRYFLRSEKQKYRFRICASPVLPKPSEWSQPSPLGISEAQLELLRYEFQPPDKLEDLGHRLGEALFRDRNILGLFYQSLSRARERNQRLRLLFSHESKSESSALSLPWECLYESLFGDQKDYFGLAPSLGVARFVPKPDASSIRVTGRLTVLVAVSDPRRDLPPLEIEKELERMNYIAAQRSEQIAFHSLTHASWADLKAKLPEVNPHVLIFAGHCGIRGGKPHLAFEAPERAAEYVPVSTLALTIKPHLGKTLGLVVLSACQSAVHGGAARILIDEGVPAVVAMQSKILDSAGREFDLQLFSYLLQQQTIDAAVNAGRMAILEVERSSFETRGSQWPIPVLYLASRTDDLFDLREISQRARRRAQVEASFPRLEPNFIERPELRKRLAAGSAKEGITVLRGPFGSGKTQLVSELCLTELHSPSSDADGEEPFFFYVAFGDRFKTLQGVVKELDRQARNYKFLGFLDLLKRREQDDWALAAGLSELLAAYPCMVVFDDFDPRYGYERPLFERLASHLRTSRVCVVTSSPDLMAVNANYVTIDVGGFTSEEVKAFFAPVTKQTGEIPTELMEAAARFDNLPWFMRQLMKRREERPLVSSPGSLVEDIEARVTEGQRKVITQLAILRRPVGLQEVAAMLDRANQKSYLEAAVELQNLGILSFALDLKVELPLPLREHFYDTMPLNERLQRHLCAAAFFERRAKATRTEGGGNAAR
jgi:hypothetical protein